MADRIVLGPGNPRDVKPEELQGLVAQLEQLSDEYVVTIETTEQKGYGVTWWEVLWVHIPWHEIDGAIAGAVVKALIDWARERFKTKPSRPKSITILGPGGETLKKVLLKDAQSEPEEELPSADKR